MRTWMVRLGCILIVSVGGFTAWSLSWGQERPVSPAVLAPVSPGPAQPASTEPRRSAHDLVKLSFFQRQIYLSAQRGTEWLQGSNRADGRFQYGYVPALRKPLEGDHYLRQVGAAFALARAARFFQEERLGAIARQAVLTLLLDTEKDPQNPQVRRTTFPSSVVNRLAAAGLLVLTIQELPAPGADLLEQAEELCNYIRAQQRPDGSLSLADGPDEAKTGAAEADGSTHYPGLALYGLMRSQQLRPMPWKTEVVRKAQAYYHKAWRANKQMAPIPALTAAYAEAYLLTHEQTFADSANEMNDWLCTLQYQQLDRGRLLWLGGFMGWADGKAALLPPRIDSAACAESLAEACRVARQAGDVQRYQRYREALERCLQFLTTLQYTEANSQHFADWYRPEVLGAFYASHQDGNLRIDYTQHAVCALVQYLTHVIERP